MFELYAIVTPPTYTTFLDTDIPKRVFRLPDCRRVLVDTYDTRADAQWWAINTKRVWIDAAKTRNVTEHGILGFEIEET